MIKMVACGTRSSLGPGWVLTTTVDQTPRDFSLRVWGHGLNAFDGHHAKYSPTVRNTTINIRVGSSLRRASRRETLRNETFEISVGEVCACVLQPECEILSNTNLSAIRGESEGKDAAKWL